MTHSTGQPPASAPAFPNIHGSTFAEDMRRLEISIPDPWNAFSSTLADQSQSPNDRFASLYGMLQILNRQYRYDEYSDLVKNYQSHFGNEPYFQTFRALAARGDGTNKKDLRRAARYAETAVQKLPDRPGVLHQYASIIADLTEATPRSEKKEIGLFMIEGVERSAAVGLWWCGPVDAATADGRCWPGFVRGSVR